MVKSQLFVRYFWRAIPAVALATLLSACTTPSQPTALTAQQGAHQRTGFLHQTSQDEFEEMVYNVDVKSKIMNQYARWKGVRYRMGGETRRGIDCSAFVQRTFREQFGLDLPRSTSHQKDSGSFIMRTKLRAGDLVLFRSGSTGRHIGIYVGNDNFVHASASSGVMISNLNDSYWKNRYREARRVLNYPHS